MRDIKLLQKNPERPGPLTQQPRLRERLQDDDNDSSNEDDNSESESDSDSDDGDDNDSIDAGDGDDLNDVIVAFIDDEEEVERPPITRLGRAIKRRSEIDFFFLLVLYILFEEQRVKKTSFSIFLFVIIIYMFMLFFVSLHSKRTQILVYLILQLKVPGAPQNEL